MRASSEVGAAPISRRCCSPAPTSRDGLRRGVGRGSRRGFLGVEQAEAGRARAGHAGEPASRQRGDRAEHVGDRRRDADRGRFEVVALVGEPGEQRLALVRCAPEAGRAGRRSPGARPSASNTGGVGMAMPG